MQSSVIMFKISFLFVSVWLYSLARGKESLHNQNQQCANVRAENMELEEEMNQLEESHK